MDLVAHVSQGEEGLDGSAVRDLCELLESGAHAISKGCEGILKGIAHANLLMVRSRLSSSGAFPFALWQRQIPAGKCGDGGVNGLCQLAEGSLCTEELLKLLEIRHGELCAIHLAHAFHEVVCLVDEVDRAVARLVCEANEACRWGEGVVVVADDDV